MICHLATGKTQLQKAFSKVRFRSGRDFTDEVHNP